MSCVPPKNIVVLKNFPCTYLPTYFLTCCAVFVWGKSVEGVCGFVVFAPEPGLPNGIFSYQKYQFK
jgi:hypothetical protein